MQRIIKRVKCLLTKHQWTEWEGDKFYPSTSRLCKRCRLSHSKDHRENTERFSWAVGSNWRRARLFKRH